MATVANTYARALADVVFGKHLDPAATLREAQSMAQLAAGNRELREVWEAPSIPSDQKRALLDAIVAREAISGSIRNFVAVLIDHRRIHFLGAIVEEFEDELNRRMGFAEASITSARALEESERRGLESQIERLTGKKVRATYAMDPAILGGAIVRVGSTIYDGSVKGQLERIREQLISG